MTRHYYRQRRKQTNFMTVTLELKQQESKETTAAGKRMSLHRRYVSLIIHTTIVEMRNKPLRMVSSNNKCPTRPGPKYIHTYTYVYKYLPSPFSYLLRSWSANNNAGP
ncbi:unnamed protein product [Ceratitis capitata]|uniref:(Mediterranean fruit fly) hypothetical protein n=1 Tax=Ceratitis capitata TaxID=7213 RepID=A0A811VHT8_CERCA|nr:unnamed protein product [Ceratitis capitata]